MPTVEIPNTVSRIESSTFSWATGLTSITIPSSINYIGSTAFYNCSRLATITCENTDPDNIVLSSHVFQGVNKTTCTLYVPKGSKELYATASQWKDFVNIVEMPDSPTIPGNLEIADSTIGTGVSKCFNAYDTITVAGIDTVIFANGATVDLIAGHSIRFLPGFNAKSGSYMNAHITTDSSFCDTSAPSPIVATQKSESVYELENTFEQEVHTTSKSMKVYPNPNKGRFTISLINFHSNAEIVIYSSTGLVIQRTVANTDNAMDLTTVQHGIYFVRVTDGKDQYVQKIIIH